MPETDVKRISAAELKKLYGGRTRKENLEIMLGRIKLRFNEVRLISGYISGTLDAPHSTVGNTKEEDR